MLKFKKILFILSLLFLVVAILPEIYVVTSGSMEPFIKSGSLAITKKINPKFLKIGDVIAFTSPNNPQETILHRINSIKSQNPLHFSTKGDNNNIPDQWDVIDVGVKGIYLFSIPLIGRVINFIHYPLGFILIICLPVLLFIISELFKIQKIIDDEVDRRVKKELKKNLKKTIVSLFLLLIPIKDISAFYTSQASISGMSFSIGDIIPPKSFINLNENYTRNIYNFDIDSQATDNVSVSDIKLYYSFNYNSWQLFPEIITDDDGTFHFNSPNGNGLYSFECLATDSSGNAEIKDFNYFDYQIKVDTIPPTTNLNQSSLGAHIYNGQNYLTNGNFEDGMNGWIAASSIGDHHIVNEVGTTNNTFLLGSDTKSINGTDSLYQIISLPVSSSSTLNFSFRFFSHDTVDYDFFNVNISDLSDTNILKTILNFGNLNSDDFNYDSGWQNLSQSLLQFAGQTIKLYFNLTDTGIGDTNNSWVYLDNIGIFTLDTRVEETSTVNFLATDLGSDIIETTPDSTLNIGENNLTFSSIDSSENIEAINSQSILVSPTLVINKISSYVISLFNNLYDESVNLTNYFYSIDDGTLIPIDNLNIILSTPLPDSCQIKLFFNDDLLDSVSVTNLDSASWQRSTDGLGPWVKINSPPSFNLESRLAVSKITLSVSGLASTLADMSYTINYSDSSGLQQIYGQILPNTIDSSGISSRDLYLGTCSSGGTCSPALGLGTSFVVTFSNLAPQTYIF